jgi:hypothetical protein
MDLLLFLLVVVLLGLALLFVVALVAEAATTSPPARCHHDRIERMRQIRLEAQHTMEGLLDDFRRSAPSGPGR